MIAKVTAPPFSSLSDTQQLVVNALRTKSKTTHELQDETHRNYSVINRALKDLAVKNWVEIDPVYSGGRANAWTLKQIPSDSIELLVDNGLGKVPVTFNKYFEATAQQLKGGVRPKLMQAQERFYKALAKLGYYAAVGFVGETEVTETQLLEVRSAVQGFIKALEEAHSISQQLLVDERIWHADTLTEGVMRKTDRYLTPADMAKYAQLIDSAFNKPVEKSDSIEDDDTNNEEEQDSADD